jgi:hypothetical protein
LIPAVVDGLQIVAQGAQPGQVAAHQQGQAVDTGQCAREAAVDTPRSAGCGWIDALPALSGEPDLGPGMGIGLAHDEGAVHSVDFATLVARDDPRGDAGGTQGDDEGGSEVLAEALAGLEQETVHIIPTERQGVEGVGQLDGLKVGDDQGRDLTACPRFGAQAGAEGAGARVAFRRKIQGLA